MDANGNPIAHTSRVSNDDGSSTGGSDESSGGGRKTKSKNDRTSSHNDARDTFKKQLEDAVKSTLENADYTAVDPDQFVVESEFVVPGGAKNGSGRNGSIDVIVIDRENRVAYVLEVKSRGQSPKGPGANLKYRQKVADRLWREYGIPAERILPLTPENLEQHSKVKLADGCECKDRFGDDWDLSYDRKGTGIYDQSIKTPGQPDSGVDAVRIEMDGPRTPYTPDAGGANMSGPDSGLGIAGMPMEGIGSNLIIGNILSLVY